jgi:hypothetical protein
MLPTVNAIWIGPQLGLIHTACLCSFLRHGHRVVLHCYERPRDTPPGIELADASALLPQSRIIRHRKTGSVALFSDILRYEILGAGLGLYVDCDMFCLRPIEDAGYIFGWESDTSLATGVLKLPSDCHTLAALRAIKDTVGFVPPWRKSRRRSFQWLRGSARPASLEELPWATIGPRAFTYYAKEHGIERFGSPIDRFYSVHWEHAKLLFDPALRLDDLITHRTDALHLCNNSISHTHVGERISKFSPLWQVINSENGKVRQRPYEVAGFAPGSDEMPLE